MDVTPLLRPPSAAGRPVALDPAVSAPLQWRGAAPAVAAPEVRPTRRLLGAAVVAVVAVAAVVATVWTSTGAVPADPSPVTPAYELVQAEIDAALAAAEAARVSELVAAAEQRANVEIGLPTVEQVRAAIEAAGGGPSVAVDPSSPADFAPLGPTWWGPVRPR